MCESTGKLAAYLSRESRDQEIQGDPDLSTLHKKIGIFGVSAPTPELNGDFTPSF